jgi:UPF0755 protein
MRFLKYLLLLIVAASVALGGAAWWWLHQPLRLNPPSLEFAELDIDPGSSPRRVADAVAKAGVQLHPGLLYAWFRLSGLGPKLKAGNYAIEPGTSPWQLSQELVQGAESQQTVTLVEGWTFQQFRQALAKAPHLRPVAQDWSHAELMARLGREGQGVEGRFFPDTYHYAKGSTDLAVWRRALHVMDKRLAAAWAVRKPGAQVKSPQEALILASIIEKETGKASDRPMIASVFHNRLRIGMLLQTDPTVIYGMGAAFDGNLRRKDLQTDTPWNTYTRAGLPPTPIAMPGAASLLAAVQPAESKALYFVARGDGSSQFSNNLDDHNRAVNKYQRGGK